MRALHLFAGAGGSLLAGRIMGWDSVGAVEWDPFCRRVLRARGERVTGADVRHFNGERYAGAVDVVVGGSPCQDLSIAGKRAGLAGARSGLWGEQLRIAVECRAPFIFWENVQGALSSNAGRDFGVILSDLAAHGYNARWCVVRASDVGAPHARARVFLLANADGASGFRAGQPVADRAQHAAAGRRGDALADAYGAHGQGKGMAGRVQNRHAARGDGGRSAHAGVGAPGHQSGLGGESDGLAVGMDWPAARGDWPHGKGSTQARWEAPRIVASGEKGRIQRLKALGNGWVPHQAVYAFNILWAMYERGE